MLLKKSLVAFLAFITFSSCTFCVRIKKSKQVSTQIQTVAEISSQKEYLDILKNKKPVVILFSSPTCGPCNAMKPHFNRIAQEHKNQINFYTLNIAQHPFILAEKNITGVPVLIYYRKGIEVTRDRGGMSYQDLKRGISSFLATQTAITTPSEQSPKVTKKTTPTHTAPTQSEITEKPKDPKQISHQYTSSEKKHTIKK